MAPIIQHLPVKAIVEGPSACFRLLDIDDSVGMKHADYTGLLYSATDNRLAEKSFRSHEDGNCADFGTL